MCGRFTLTTRDFTVLAEMLGVEPDPELAARYRPRYNIAPDSEHFILRLDDQRRLFPASWGLPRCRPGHALQINARAETAMTLPMFRRAFAERRCVIPADGFFEWAKEGARRRPFWFHGGDGDLVLMAGLYDAAPEGLRFAILTTAANDQVSPIHDRMPAVLGTGDVDAWLSPGPPERLSALLRPAPAGALVATEVSRRVSSARFDDPACLDPPGADELAPGSSRPTCERDNGPHSGKPGQLGLFRREDK